jgi:peptide/nickel transport system permease protein
VGQPPTNDFWRRAFRSQSFLIGLTITVIVLAMAMLSVVWTPYSILDQNIPNRLKWPGGDNLLGTDQFGRDVLSMVMVGARASIGVALVAIFIGAGIGVPLGLAAAAGQRWLSELIMRSSDFIFAFPSLLLALLLTSVYGFNVWNAMIAIGIFNIPVFARLAHGASLAIWQREFVMAARASGKGAVRISAEHILPNITNILIVQGTIQFSLGIIIEAGLSYVGVGTQPPMSSWGRMLAESQTLVYTNSYLAIVPGVAIVLTVLGLNLLGDGLRDLLDPRLARTGRGEHAGADGDGTA